MKKTKKKKLKYVIIRSYAAGVFAGELEKAWVEGSIRIVSILNSRRIHHWDGAASLSQLAMEGVTEPANCRFAMEVGKEEISNVIEIINTTPMAEKCIKGVTVWKR